MSRPVGKPSSIVPTALKSELEQADASLREVADAQDKSTKLLTEAHAQLENARRSAHVKPSPVEDVLYQKWPMLNSDLAAAWQSAKAELLGERGVDTQKAWDRSTPMPDRELRSVKYTREAIAFLLADADPKYLANLRGDTAAVIHASKSEGLENGSGA